MIVNGGPGILPFRGYGDESRAGEGIRTPDVQLGKLAFYH